MSNELESRQFDNFGRFMSLRRMSPFHLIFVSFFPQFPFKIVMTFHTNDISAITSHNSLIRDHHTKQSILR